MSDLISQLSPDGQAINAYLQGLSDDQIEVPMLPDVANQVLALSNDPDSDAAQLAKLIQGDQSLAGHVMRIANSAAYTPNASMVSLQQAIARLGMSLITEIALAASLNTKLFKAPDFETRIAEIWDHALCTALWGKEVARVSKKNVEAAFLCGLLHSISKPVILQMIYDYCQQNGKAISLDDALLIETIQAPRFASVILAQWKMPLIVQESVLHYENYKEAGTHRDAAAVTQGAVHLATASLSEDAEFDSVLSAEVFADLNLYDDDIERLSDQADRIKTGLEALRS